MHTFRGETIRVCGFNTYLAPKVLLLVYFRLLQTFLTDVPYILIIIRVPVESKRK